MSTTETSGFRSTESTIETDEVSVVPVYESANILRRSSMKRKHVAIALAVFYGSFSWLYTARLDWWKLAVSLPLIFIFFLEFSLFLAFGDSGPLFYRYMRPKGGDYGFGTLWILSIGFLFVAVTWIWPVVERTLRPKEWYRHYGELVENDGNF